MINLLTVISNSSSRYNCSHCTIVNTSVVCVGCNEIAIIVLKVERWEECIFELIWWTAEFSFKRLYWTFANLTI